MALVPAAAAAVAAGAYLNARYHIAKDLGSIYNLNASERRILKAATTGKLNLFNYFEEQVHRLPASEECIWSREGCYTWKEAHSQACRYAQFLLSHNVKPQELVAFYLTNSPEFMFATQATWAIGTAPAYINYHLADDALIHCVRVSGAKIILVDWDDGCRARIEGVRSRLESELGVKIIILDEAMRANINSLPPTRPPNSLRGKETVTSPMFLLYTSGSTGHPKAVPFPVTRAIQTMHDGRKESIIGIRSGPNGDRYYNCMPLYHGTGGVVACGCMLNGVTLCIGKRFSTSRFWEDVRNSDSTAFVYVGETARYLLAAPDTGRDRDHKIRVMFGNGMRPDVFKKFQDRFGIDTVAEFFNSTEGVFGLLNLCRGPYLQGCVGHSGLLLKLLYRNYYIAAEVDHDTGDLWRDPKTGFGQQNSLEKGGEILVGVPDESLFPGYYKNPEATQKKFVRNLFKKGDLWYRTGDALRRSSDGRWFFLDRLGDTYRWKSENVATAEVAETLGHHPGILEASVYGVEVPGHDGRAGCAAIHLKPGQEPTPAFFAELLQYSLDKLPRYAVPVFVRLLREVKPMHNQKQNKVPLKKDGINLDAIYGGARKDVADAKEEGKDVMYFWPSALAHPNPGLDGERYIEFSRSDWNALRGVKERRRPSRL